MHRQKDVLRYTRTKAASKTVARHYMKWREAQGIPFRCDEPSCSFHVNQLTWNEKPLGMILDHANGNNSDNRPQNLRFLCPNCDSQLDTRGGRNRGKVEKSEGGFAIVPKDGKRAYVLPAESGEFKLGGEAC
jgi:HNH endonuclease